MRRPGRSGQLDYVPICLEEVPKLLATGRLPIDVALLQVSPPDARGFVSLGVSVDLAPAVLAVARHVIAEVNPAMPRTHGESFVHVDHFDALVSVDTPVTEYRHPPTGETAQMVARYIAAIIDDGSTLQIGLGRVPNEALRYLTDRRDLGIHSDVITDGVVDLVEAGVVTGRHKTHHRERIVTSYCLGTRRLYDFVARQSARHVPADRPGLRSRGGRRQPAHGLDHAGLRRGPHRAGLRRPVRRRILRRRLHPGGIHPRRGAFGRRQADHLPRLHHGKRRLADQAAPGGRRGRGDCAVGRPLRVTEYGIAYLFGKSIRERAVSLIEVAHPSRREELLAAAKRLGYVPPEQYLASQAAYPVHEERRVSSRTAPMS